MWYLRGVGLYGSSGSALAFLEGEVEVVFLEGEVEAGFLVRVEEQAFRSNRLGRVDRVLKPIAEFPVSLSPGL